MHCIWNQVAQKEAIYLKISNDDVAIMLVVNKSTISIGMHYYAVQNEGGRYETYNQFASGDSLADTTGDGGFVYGYILQ